ncbi:hypothetical protein [Cysteiniphilum sp. 6C5]|uniref:hypothetical protein n=1 Tax=Cysteiniphilum TaxID=2056696 RepID=UPI003F84A2A7
MRKFVCLFVLFFSLSASFSSIVNKPNRVHLFDDVYVNEYISEKYVIFMREHKSQFLLLSQKAFEMAKSKGKNNYTLIEGNISLTVNLKDNVINDVVIEDE